MDLSRSGVKSIAFACVGLCAASATAALAAAPDGDLCMFDLPAISKAKFEKVDPNARNLVTNPNFREKEDPKLWTSWRRLGSWSPWSVEKGPQKEFNERFEKTIEISFGDGLASIRNTRAAVEATKNTADVIHSYVGKFVKLAHATGGVYRVTFRYRSNHELGMPSYYAYCFVDSCKSAADPKSVPSVVKDAKQLVKDIKDSGEDSDYWFNWEGRITVPPGADWLKVTFRFMGIGYLKFTDFRIVEERAECAADVTFLVKPYGLIDDRFAIEAGRVGLVHICSRARKGYEYQWWKSDYEYVIPPGFEYVGSTLGEKGSRFRREKLPDGSERIVFPMAEYTNPITGGYHDGFGVGCLVRAKGAVGTEGKLAFRMLRDGRQCGETGSVTLDTVPPFAVTQPKRYRACAILSYNFSNFRGNAAASAAYADYLRSKGVSWLMPNTPVLVADRTLVPMWRRKGFDLITPSDHDYLMNAYKICGTGKRPEADRFVARPGLAPNWDFPKSACPASIYEERPYFVTNIVPNLAARSLGTDGESVNWEPFYFKGCYCDHCKKLGAEWMEKTGDRNIEHFHSYQHGLLAKTVHKWMKKSFATDRVGLMPEIAWCEVGSHARLYDYPQDKLAKDYVGDFEWIPAWGPYIGWSPLEDGAYNGIRGRLSAYFFAAKDVREEVDRNYKVKGKGEGVGVGVGVGVGRPKLMAQPAGPNWVIQPAWLEVSMDSYFFNRWEAIAPWSFPYGADARHWKAYANAVNRAAKYEDAVWDGTRNDAATTLKYKSGYEAKCVWPDKMFLTKIRDVDLIQQTTYDYRDARYVACFNLNDLKEAAFTLRTTGLDDGDYEVVAEDGRPLFGGKAFSAEELATKGVDLTLPVSACRVFTLKPVARSWWRWFWPW